MSESSHADAAVRAKAALVDPATMTVLWSNEPAEQGAPARTLEQVIPLAESMGVLDAVGSVAASGAPRHLRTSLVSTGRGDMEIATSVYRLPDGTVLVLSENAWQPRDGRDGTAGSSRPKRRKR